MTHRSATFGSGRRETTTPTSPPTGSNRDALDAWEQTDEELLRRIRLGWRLDVSIYEARRRGIYGTFPR